MKAAIAIVLVALAAGITGCSTKEAKAACGGSGDESLPDLKYIDTTGVPIGAVVAQVLALVESARARA